MNQLPHEQLLGQLEQHHLRLTQLKHSSKQHPKLLPFIEAIYSEFHNLIADHGDVQDKASLNALCATLDEAERTIATTMEIPEDILKPIQSLRRTARKVLERSVGWRPEPLHEHSQPTATGLLGLDVARREFGETPLHLHGSEYLKEEELRASLAIAAILGEVALADYWSATEPERFAFNNRTIENLRSWIGDVQSYSGTFVEDIPIKLLTLPHLKCLRDLLFAALRDKYFSEYYRDSVQGVDPVLTALDALRSRVSEQERLDFVDDLVDYFLAVDNIQLPSRLREGLGMGEEFPGKHQRIAMQEISLQRQLLLADPTGGGKTGSCIASFESLRDQGLAKRMLITCPSGIVGEWEKRLTDAKGGYFKEGTRPNVVVIAAGDPNRAATWERARNAEYVIISIEMCNEKTDGKNHVDRAREIGADYFVVDEAHNVRNPKGNETENIFQISQCDSIRNGYTVAATATPVYNTIRDVAAQLRLLNAGQDRLKDAQGVPDGVDFSDIQSLTRAITSNHTRLVRNLLKLRMLRRELLDCLPVGTTLTELPPVETPLSPLEQEIYDGILDMPFYETAMEKIQALQRACTHAEQGSDNTGIIGTTKLRQMRDAILACVDAWRREPTSHHGKIVLAIPEGHDARGVTRDFRGRNDAQRSDADSFLIGRLRKELKQHDIAVFILDGSNTGSLHLKDDQGTPLFDIDGAPLTATKKVITDFRTHIGPAVLAVRSDVGSEGIDLSFASRNFFASPSSVKASEDQQIGREYRKGQEHDVVTQHLIIQNSIERGKWEFARRKQRIIEDLLNGKPLSRDEIDLLHSETKTVRRGGFLGYASKTPRQKVTHHFNQMFRRGKHRIREYLAADDGHRGRELAELYHQVEDLGIQGNNRRMLLALLQKHADTLLENHGGRLEIADIAAGTLGIARALEDDERFTVWSSDISGAMLEVGKNALKDPASNDRIAEASMDDLPYKNGSKNVAFLSLALDCTRHNSRSLDKGGGERINTFLELNRILSDDGIAFVSMQPGLFQNSEAFEKFSSVIQDYFGFTVMSEDTGFARSTDHEDEEAFEGVILTIRKTGKPSCSAATLPLSSWMALDFYRKAPVLASEKDRFRRMPGVSKSPPPGAYHEEFAIGDAPLVFEVPDVEPEERKQHREGKKRYKKTCEEIERLLLEHGTIKAIPVEKLLSISLETVDAATQQFRDHYFRELLRKYNGKIADIPLEEISGESPVILMSKYEKKIGWFLVLAKTKEQTKKIGSFGKKYFCEDEFEKS